MIGLHRGTAPLAVALLGLAAALVAAWAGSGPRSAGAIEGDAQDALVEGNRWVRAGDPEAAVAAYSRGWPAAGATGATLAYNLATTLHRQERRAEALLWYLRAAELAPDDPWLVDNLALVRAELAAPRVEPRGWTYRLGRHRRGLAFAAIGAAWLALGAYLLVAALGARRGPGRWPRSWRIAAWVLPASLALILWLAGTVAEARAPRQAVLVAPCGEAPHRWPAGSEVWVHRRAEGDWSLASADPVSCPTEGVGLVEPPASAEDSP